MEMLLMGLCMSLFGVAISVAAFKASTLSKSEEQPSQATVPVLTPARGRFFRDTVATVPMHTQVPIEVLIRQIESHVRMEQAVAESFVDLPTEALLHSRTSSPLVN
jgi:hypothetical protein